MDRKNGQNLYTMENKLVVARLSLQKTSIPIGSSDCIDL